MRVADDVELGQAEVSIECDGWPEGRVVASRYTLPVVARKSPPTVKLSPEHQRAWSVDGYEIDWLHYLPCGRRMVVKLRRLVGYQPKVQLDEIITRTIDYWRGKAIPAASRAAETTPAFVAKRAFSDLATVGSSL